MDTMTEKPKVGKCKIHNWVEESAVEDLDLGETCTHIQRRGHKGILSTDQNCKMESVTTHRAAYGQQQSPAGRVQGIRADYLKRQIAQEIRKKFDAAQTPPVHVNDYSTTTQRDFSVQGFTPRTPKTTKAHDYKTEEAVTFWSENHQRVQGVTAAQTMSRPFRKSTKFSLPIPENLDLDESR